LLGSFPIAANPHQPAGEPCRNKQGTISTGICIIGDYFADYSISAILACGAHLGAVDDVGEAVAAGVAKFTLRPAAKSDDDIVAQTRRLIDEVLPLVAARCPKPQRRQVAERLRLPLHLRSVPTQCKSGANRSIGRRCRSLYFLYHRNCPLWHLT
jgi:hypothetical protein